MEAADAVPRRRRPAAGAVAEGAGPGGQVLEEHVEDVVGVVVVTVLLADDAAVVLGQQLAEDVAVEGGHQAVVHVVVEGGPVAGDVELEERLTHGPSTSERGLRNLP